MHKDGEEKFDKYVSTYNKKYRFLLISTIFVSLTIALLWGMAFKNKVSVFQWNTSSEKKLIDDAKLDWKITNEAITADQRAEEYAQETVRKKLIEINQTNSIKEKTATTTGQADNTPVDYNLPTSTSITNNSN